MRLAILSDVHGNLVALEAVLDALTRDAPDASVNLGDSATGPLWPRETIERLATLGLPTVRGNHDRWLTDRALESMSPSMRFTHAALTDSQRRMLADLPADVRLDDVLAVHGTPASDTDYLLEDAVDGRLALARPADIAARLGETDATLVLCGHSHHQHIASGPGDCVIVNPGSVGCPRYADNDDPFVAEAGSTHARYAVATKRRGAWSVELKAIAYDWSAVLARAMSVRRSDFAAGFVAHRGRTAASRAIRS